MKNTEAEIHSSFDLLNLNPIQICLNTVKLNSLGDLQIYLLFFVVLNILYFRTKTTEQFRTYYIYTNYHL